MPSQYNKMDTGYGRGSGHGNGIGDGRDVGNVLGSSSYGSSYGRSAGNGSGNGYGKLDAYGFANIYGSGHGWSPESIACPIIKTIMQKTI